MFQIEEELKKVQEQNAREITIEDRAVKDGDILTIDYSGSVDGVKFEGGPAEDQTLVIGSGAFIPGFEEQLVGKNKRYSRYQRDIPRRISCT